MLNEEGSNFFKFILKDSKKGALIIGPLVFIGYCIFSIGVFGFNYFALIFCLAFYVPVFMIAYVRYFTRRKTVSKTISTVKFENICLELSLCKWFDQPSKSVRINYKDLSIVKSWGGDGFTDKHDNYIVKSKSSPDIEYLFINNFFDQNVLNGIKSKINP